MEQDANQKNAQVPDTGDAETEIRKLVNRHIQNKNDVISEEEFRNIKVGVSLPEDEITEQTPLPPNSDTDATKGEPAVNNS